MPTDAPMPCITLSNGVGMPMLGLGTSMKGGYNHEAVIFALKECGYRMIDTAARYNNERLIAEAIKSSGVEREEVFIISKLWPAQAGYDSTLAAFQQSCINLGTDYLDLYLIHWPDVPSNIIDKRKCRADTWRAMEEIYRAGKSKCIGVSNFLIEHLNELIEDSEVVPHVNQIEFHPYQNPQELITYCKQHGIHIQGYSPLAKATILTERPIMNMSEKYDKTPAQILLRWATQQGVSVIPKSTKFHRLAENMKVFEFSMTSADLITLNGLHSNHHVVYRSLVQGKIDGKVRSSQPDISTIDNLAEEVVIDKVLEEEVVIDKVLEEEVVIDKVLEEEVVIDKVLEEEVVIDKVLEEEVVIDKVLEEEVVIEEVVDEEVVADNVVAVVIVAEVDDVVVVAEVKVDDVVSSVRVGKGCGGSKMDISNSTVINGGRNISRSVGKHFI